MEIFAHRFNSRGYRVYCQYGVTFIIYLDIVSLVRGRKQETAKKATKNVTLLRLLDQ
jgi:hypothetical protein